MSKTTHVNPITGRLFKDEEAEPLSAAMQVHRFKEPKWATFWQWKGTGRLVRKGEQGVTLTGSSGFQWRVFNVSQTEEIEAEAARTPVARPAAAPQAPQRQTKSRRAPDLKKSIPSGAPGAPSVKARVAVVVDNPHVQRTVRTTIKRKPNVHGGSAVGEIDKPEALPDTVDSAREIIRLNKFLSLTEDEARALVRQHPTRRFFEPDEVAAIYGTGKAATATPQGAHRAAEAKRWLGLWKAKARTHQKIGALKTWAWLVFTGRLEEAEKYRQHAHGRRPGTE